jgi:hypothetical protein
VKTWLGSARYRLMKATGRTLDDVVFLEGGLGSQLLGMMLYLERRDVDPATRVDASYFDAGLGVPTDDPSGLVLRPWELHRYGIAVSSLGSVSRRLRIRLSPCDQALADKRFMALVAERDWSRTFPIVEASYSELRRHGLSTGEKFGCIHLRRGDYLKVSSRVVGINEVLALCQRVEGLLPERLVFLSDDPFTSDERQSVAAAFPARDCIFASGEDQHAVHGVMRMSSLLVTSNSTFSWSAGLLTASPDTVVLSPQSFFGPSNADINGVFQSGSDWMMMCRPQR